MGNVIDGHILSSNAPIGNKYPFVIQGYSGYVGFAQI